MKKERTLRLNKNFIPCDAYENEEIYPNGIFHFNISRILEHIISGQLIVQQEDICVPDWYKSHYTGNDFNKEHLKTVNLDKPVIQAEISPGRFNIIDGNHRLEKAQFCNKLSSNSHPFSSTFSCGICLFAWAFYFL